MPILNNVSLFFAKLNPKRPSPKFNPANPTWELQLRTTSIEQRDEWRKNNLKPKLMVAAEDTPNAGELQLSEDGKKQWRVNLRKRSKDSEGKPAAPVIVVDGGMSPIDPDTIGNGSVGNIRIFQYDTKNEQNPIGTTLMAVQVTKHVVYERGPSDDDFNMTDTEVIKPAPKADSEDDDALAPPPKKTSPTVDADDDSAY